MNDYVMNQLAAERRHQFETVAHHHRLAREARAGKPRRASAARSRGSRSTGWRLTLSQLLGRSMA